MAVPLVNAPVIAYVSPMRPPDLFDADLLALRRARAARLGPADFLHQAAADEILDRLAEVNRTFRDAAVVTPGPGSGRSGWARWRRGWSRRRRRWTSRPRASIS